MYENLGPMDDRKSFGQKWYVIAFMALLYVLVIAADLLMLAFDIHGWWAGLWGAGWYIIILLPYYLLFSYVYKGSAWFEKIFNKIARGSESLFRLLFLLITYAFIIIAAIVLSCFISK